MRDDSTVSFFPWFLAVAGFTAFAICATANRAADPSNADDLITPLEAQVITAPRPEEAVYRIGPTLVDLANGSFKENGDKGATVQVVSVPFRADLDRNGTEDAVVILRRDEGTQNRYYIGGAMRRGDQFEGTDMFLIGDRIVLGYSTFSNGLVVQEYTEPNGAKKTLYLKVVDGTVIDGRENPISPTTGLD